MQNTALTNHSAIKTKNRQFASTLLTGILMLICIMLAMVIGGMQAYHYQQTTAKQHLQNYAHLYAELAPAQRQKPIIQNTDSKTRLFSPTAEPSADFSFPLDAHQDPRLLSLDKWRKLGWDKGAFSDVVLIMRLPDTKNPRFVVTEIPKRKLFQLFVTIGLYLSIVMLVILFAYSLFSHAREKRRLAYINQAALEIINGNIDKRIPINPAVQDEYAAVSQTLNIMLHKNAQLLQELRQVNNNIAHDLKSPLNRMRSRIETALLHSTSLDDYHNALANSLDDIDGLLKIFQALLLMGNLDANHRNYQLKPTALSSLLTKLAELYETVSEEKQHTFTSSIPADVMVIANQDLFAQAISNLLDNAIKYTPSGGNIKLTLTQSGACALISIIDNGPGIATEQQHIVFERFKRLDNARQLPGTGLGMSLVKSILTLHNASIQLHDNHPGLRVEIRLQIVSQQ